MLGINSKREPIRGEYAKLIRELMRRVYSGQLNERIWSKSADTRKYLSKDNIFGNRQGGLWGRR